jgi:hypothetical protein
VVAIADGLVWAELGAAMPRSGGGYQYLLDAYGPNGAGRLMSFLFLWSMVTTMPLLMASGAVGFAHYAAYLYPAMTAWQTKLLAMSVCLVSMLLINRQIDGAGRCISRSAQSCCGVVDCRRRPAARRLNLITFPPAPGICRASSSWAWAAPRCTPYDYGGYNTVCSVGGGCGRKSPFRAVIVATPPAHRDESTIIGVMPGSRRCNPRTSSATSSRTAWPRGRR